MSWFNSAPLIACTWTLKLNCLKSSYIVSRSKICGSSSDNPLRWDSLKIPSGIQEKAVIGLNLLKEAVIELAKSNTDGVTNAECAKVLGLQSNYGGGSQDYLSYSLLGLLLEEGQLKRDDKLGKGRHISILK